MTTTVTATAPTTAGALPGSGQGVAGGTTTAPPADPDAIPGPSIDEQQRAAELSGFRTEPGETGTERAGPEGGTNPAPRQYGGATGEHGGAR